MRSFLIEERMGADSIARAVAVGIQHHSLEEISELKMPSNDMVKYHSGRIDGRRWS